MEIEELPLMDLKNKMTFDCQYFLCEKKKILLHYYIQQKRTRPAGAKTASEHFA